MTTLRTAGPKDAKALAQLWRETFRQAYKTVHAAEDITSYCEAHFAEDQALTVLEDEAAVCRLAETGGAMIGYSVVRHHACAVPLPGGSSELKQIYVLASAYGSGAGRALFDDALAAIRNARHRWVWLHVSDINQRAMAFYRKLGFERRGAGPEFEVGQDRLASSLLVREAQRRDAFLS